jgi:hypothetical protein
MINLCYVSNNMNNKTHSEICLLTVSNKFILYKPIGYYTYTVLIEKYK